MPGHPLTESRFHQVTVPVNNPTLDNRCWSQDPLQKAWLGCSERGSGLGDGPAQVGWLYTQLASNPVQGIFVKGGQREVGGRVAVAETVDRSGETGIELGKKNVRSL